MGYRDSYSRSTYKSSSSSPPKYKGTAAVTNALDSRQNSFKAPAQVDTNKYKTNITSISDISKKFGFDYSRGYAERQAGIQAQARRDELQGQRDRLEYETESAQTNLEHDYFAAFRNQSQEAVDSGINAGIFAERNLQLEFERQKDVASILAERQLEEQRIDTELGTVAKEEQLYADRLYDERLQQGFQNSMDYSRYMQQENQFMLDFEMRQRNQLSDEQWRAYRFNNMSAAEQAQFIQAEEQMGYDNAWREYEFNNMSEAQKQKLAADAERFGLQQAWERHKFESGLAFQAGQNNSSNGAVGAGGGAGNFTNYRLTSSFGKRRDPITGQTRNHGGNDYALPVGTPVATNVGGRVIAAGASGSGWGNYVVVQDAQGFAHIYAHLSKANVSVGSTVRPGQVVAASGNSGRSTGPHLHYEVRRGGIGGSPVNPNQWL